MSDHKIYLSPPDVGELERRMLLDAFDSGWIAPLGPHVDGFEKELADYAKRKACSVLSSGTAALHLALILEGIGPKDAVICPSLTFAATANAICYVGAEPIFVDSEFETWNLDAGVVEDAIVSRKSSERPVRAIVAVDLYGNCPNYPELLDVANKYNVVLIEDAAEALGSVAYGKMAGGFGQAGVFSFNGNKIMTTSGGGALVSDDTSWIDRSRYLATQARQPVAHYEHEDIGYNYRMSNLLAALGRAQLMGLNKKMVKREENYQFYGDFFSKVPGASMIPKPAEQEPNHWLSVVRLGNGETTPLMLIDALGKANIEARPVWKPMHQQPVFKDCQYFGAEVCSTLYSEGVCLPSGSSLDDSERQRIQEVLVKLF